MPSDGDDGAEALGVSFSTSFMVTSPVLKSPPIKGEEVFELAM
jgi:hypothetical protein